MHRTLMAGMSLLALFAVAGCAQDASTNAGMSGSSGTRLNEEASYGSGYTVPPQTRAAPGNAPGAGVPVGPANQPPSLSPGTLSGDTGVRTLGRPGGN